MIAIQNPHRVFEQTPAAFAAVPQPSGDFQPDFEAMLHWCATEGHVDRYHRQEAFRMSAEPYGIDVSELADPEARQSALVRHGLDVVRPHLQQWTWLYRHLADQDSRMLLLNVLAYRALGWRYVPMPLDSSAFWDCLQQLQQIQNHGQNISDTPLAGLAPYPMHRLKLQQLGINVELFSDAFGVFNEFIYSQYSYRGRRHVIEPPEGGVVIDCGACFGGTSLHFAEQVGPNGRVVSYEFFPENIRIFKENMRLNPELGQRVELVPQPVWSKSGVRMCIEGSGPATQVHVLNDKAPAAANLDRQFLATTIDDTVKRLKLNRVDHIKMDIEGSEMSALRGARDTIKTFRPNLAICVYHNLTDFFEVPQFLDSLDAGYRFYLQHSTVHGDETVIFARAEDPRRTVDLRWLSPRLPLWGSRFKQKIDRWKFKRR